MKDPGKRTVVMLLSALMVVLPSGCKRYEPVPPPDVKVNGNPVKRYKVRLTIPKPPGPLYVRAKINYSISNKRDCVPMDYRSALGGRHPSFSESAANPVVALSDTEYEMIFFDDAIKSEDYYGLGECNWKGTPIFTIGSGGASATAGGGPEKLGEVATRLCPVQPTGTFSSCVGEEYAGSDLQEYFAIHILTTKEQ